MKFLPTTALALPVAFAGAVPYIATRIDTRDLDTPPSGTSSIIGLTINSDGMMMADSVSPELLKKCVLTVHERPKYRGIYYGIGADTMTDSPQTTGCVYLPKGKISSIKFQKSNFDGRAFSCYIYLYDNCEGASGAWGWIKDDVPNLKNLGRDKRVNSVKCYWNADGAHWKRQFQASRKYEHALRLYADPNYQGWYKFYTQEMVASEQCLDNISDFFGISSILYQTGDQKWCAFYTSRNCNTGLRLAWFGLMNNGVGDLKNTTQDKGPGWDGQIRSVKCFKTAPPRDLYTSLAGYAQLSIRALASRDTTGEPNTEVQPRADVAVKATLKDVATNRTSQAADVATLETEHDGALDCIQLYTRRKYGGRPYYYYNETRLSTPGGYCAWLPPGVKIRSIKKGKCASWCACFTKLNPDCNINIHQHYRIVADWPTLFRGIDSEITHYQCFNTDWNSEEHGTLGIPLD